MEKVKKEKGVITIITLITVLFIVSFLISAYVVVANKVKAQKEMVAVTKSIYEPKYTMEEIYNSYFSNDKVIPIYTVEQLLAIGNGEQFNIDGKIYTFSNNEEISYVLKNNLEFIAKDLELQSDWIPIDENENFLGAFDWNGYTVEATKLDGSKKIYYQLPSTYKPIIKGLASGVTVVSYRDLEELSKDIKKAAETGKVISVLKETIEGTEKIAVIPNGFEVSTTNGEDSISAGLVVYDGTVNNRNNEFVWIPVETEFKETYSSGTDYLEPKELPRVSGTSGGNILDSQKCLDYWYEKNFYNYEEDFNYSLHYSQMVESVNKYNGFYIGRYETTLDEEGKIGSKANTRVFLINDILKEGTGSDGNPYYYKWWGLYHSQRNSNVVGNGEYIQTNMIWGQQWDAMLNFLGTDQAESTISGTKPYMVNSGTQTYDNGLKDLINNIYDLRRNVQEFTGEAYSDRYRSLRGRWL